MHDVALVVHSFAGMIVTGVAERVPERLAPLAHFDACVPYVLTAERARSDPNWRVVELADSHMANLNDPHGTAEAPLSLL
ncbi:MAG TPA: hypothetical protein VFQ80_11405 [Thermomicrobiales bacterium]|nr:hypothetical protein [Thermomicrobiales bacterium]